MRSTTFGTATCQARCPRGKVLEGGHSPRFFQRLAESVFDEADVIRLAHELADFVAGAATLYGFDDRRVFALGYSNLARPCFVRWCC